jgi:hypothetical protein
MLPGRVLTPVALIAREGEDRDALETRLEATRPVVSFPSLAHFCTDSTRKERWAGVVIARTHAWDSRLDEYVARRAFIALYALADEGYGWPDAVRRVAGPDELNGWLELIANPDAVPDDKPRHVRAGFDRPRAVRPRKEPVTKVAIPLAPARASVAADGTQLTLPMVADAGAAAGPASGDAPPPPNAGRVTTTRIAWTPRAAAKGRKPISRTPAPDPVGVAPKRRGRPAATPRADTQEAKSTSRAAIVAEVVGAERANTKPTRGQVAAENSLLRAAAELGLARAAELLTLVRQRAHRR